MFRLTADDFLDAPHLPPNWKRVDHDELAVSLGGLDGVGDPDLWGAVRGIVNSLPRTRLRTRPCRYWTPALDVMKRDVRRARSAAVADPNKRPYYNLVRLVYQACILNAGHNYIISVLERAKDPTIFDQVKKLKARVVIPALVDDDGVLQKTHPAMSDLIARQLRPGDSVRWVDRPIDFEGDIGQLLDGALSASPANTSPGINDIGYPFIRFWAKTHRDSLMRLISYGLRHDIEDGHTAHTIPIPKADKPTYDIAKSWRMIHLLPTLAKVVERMVLDRLAMDVELEETQFGSRKKRGCHDTMAMVYEFLEHNRHMSRAMLSMDIEGGFDHVDVDTLGDLMMGRGASLNTVKWVIRWANARRMRFRFNARMFKTYHTSLGIPQGSPLSLFLFGIYIADIFRPRLRYTPAIRRVVSSYVDDGLILVAADSRGKAVRQLKEVFLDCYSVAKGRGMDLPH